MRRFSGTDWLLAGVALGLGFQAFEDLVRRIVVAHEGGAYERLSLLLPQHGPGAGSGFPQYGWSPLAGGSSVPDGRVRRPPRLHRPRLRGHRARRRRLAPLPDRARTPAARAGWTAAALAIPLALWALAVVDHFGFNASLRSTAWLEGADPTVPWPLRAAWEATGHGFGRAWLLLALLAVLVALDARRLLAAARAPGGDLLAGLPWTPRHPAQLLARDVAFVVVSHAREPGDTAADGARPRPRGRHGRARARAPSAWERAPGATPSAARVRRAALVVLAALAVVALVAGPWLRPRHRPDADRPAACSAPAAACSATAPGSPASSTGSPTGGTAGPSASRSRSAPGWPRSSSSPAARSASAWASPAR